MIILFPNDCVFSARVLCPAHRVESAHEVSVLLRTIAHKLLDDLVACWMEIDLLEKGDEKLRDKIFRQMPRTAQFVSGKPSAQKLREESAGETSPDHPQLDFFLKNEVAWNWLCCFGVSLTEAGTPERKCVDWCYYKGPRPRGSRLGAISRLKTTCPACLKRFAKLRA